MLFCQNIPECIIFADFDGTIISTETYTLDTQLTVLLKQISQKVGFVIITSRGWDGIVPFIPPLYCTLPQIINNGSFIIDPLTKEVLYNRALSLNVIHKVYELINRFNLQVGFSTVFESYDNPEKLCDVDSIGRISLVVKSKELEKVIGELSTLGEISVLYGDSMRVKDGRFLVDISPKGVNKGEGVTQWLHLFGSGVKKTILVGNGENDRALFSNNYPNLVVERVAVEDGIKELKESADFIIPSADRNGFSSLLYLLAQRT